MSHHRFARVSLIVAALGLNLAPVLLGSGAQAQSKAAPAAEAAKPETVRAEMFKLLDPTAFKTMMDAKQYPELMEKLKQADAFADKTPYEIYVINRMRIALGSASGDQKMTMTALESVINSGRLNTVEQRDFTNALASYYYNGKDYANAIVWYKRLLKDGGDPATVRNLMVRAYFLSGDMATAKQELQIGFAAAEKTGAIPTEDDLRLYTTAASKTKDNAAILAGMEKLVAYYPTDDFWSDLMNRLRNKQGYNQHLDLDTWRLQMTAEKVLAAEEYTELAELALLAGYPTEAKKAIDAGFAANVLGTGSNAAKHKKLRDQATKKSADDQKTIAGDEAAANKAKDGTGLVNLGYAYVTMDQFDKGIDLIQKGLAKGGLKRLEEAKLHLGVAHAKAGHKDEAIKALQAVSGNDGITDLAHYWVLYLNRPAPKAAATPAPAAVAK